MVTFESWYGQEPRGLKKADRELKKASRAVFQMEAEICNMPATTLEDMRAKIRCAGAWKRQEAESISGGCAEAMALSIFHDIRRMTDAASI